MSSSRLNILANIGDQTIEEPTLSETQFVRFVSFAASVTPFRLLSLFASYRMDERQLVVVPDINGTRAEAGFTLRLGAFDLEARAFTFGERFAAGEERRNRGLTWSVRRAFQGWLPFVTRGPRGGTVR
jgi:hypothetical protein